MGGTESRCCSSCDREAERAKDADAKSELKDVVSFYRAVDGDLVHAELCHSSRHETVEVQRSAAEHTEAAPLWRVVSDVPVAVRRDMDVRSALMCCKHRGDLVRGRRVGERCWLRLEDEPGFIPYLGIFMGKPLLELCEAVSPRSMADPAAPAVAHPDPADGATSSTAAPSPGPAAAQPPAARAAFAAAQDGSAELGGAGGVALGLESAAAARERPPRPLATAPTAAESRRRRPNSAARWCCAGKVRPQAARAPLRSELQAAA